MPPVTVREAREADLPRVLELYRQLSLGPGDDAPPVDLAASRAMFAEMAKQPGYHLLVAEEDGAVQGTVTIVILPGFARNNRRWAVVEYVVVDAARRSRGIGAALMERAAAMAREAGCYKVMLCSNKQRPDAHRFYRRLGYRQTHEAFHLRFED
jgi:ribosomal protein S18 acetylase RimI-like enzyme